LGRHEYFLSEAGAVLGRCGCVFFFFFFVDFFFFGCGLVFLEVGLFVFEWAWFLRGVFWTFSRWGGGRSGSFFEVVPPFLFCQQIIKGFSPQCFVDCSLTKSSPLVVSLPVLFFLF